MSTADTSPTTSNSSTNRRRTRSPMDTAGLFSATPGTEMYAINLEPTDDDGACGDGDGDGNANVNFSMLRWRKSNWSIVETIEALGRLSKIGNESKFRYPSASSRLL
mmetsp:Transcript_2607/g.3612  ORF Transcript_2607/g.3612 Transcript_2607/m.3612 type:complete len:107 (+) Transcript_2607:2093-2413(+)